jgi:hypothetical protein
MPHRDAPLAYNALLRPETARAVDTMPMRAQRIADRWALAWPSEVRSLDSQGSFLDTLRSQVDLEEAALERASGPDYAHLAAHEKLELLGPPPGL